MKRIFIFGLFLTGFYLQAQIDYPRVSPKAVSEQKIGLTTIRLVYSRPAVRGRKIIGELVPYGRIWRVGANESTKITTDTEISILGNRLAAGTYALYAFPSEDRWELAFHSNTEHWGDGRDAYDPTEDVFRVVVLPENISELQENLLITFDRLTHNGANLILQWEYTRLTIPIKIDTGSIMEAEIADQLKKNPTAQTYYEAGRYLLEQSRDIDTALAYVNKAIEIGGDTYYFYRVKSELEAESGQYDQAIQSATRSLELADSLGKDEFVRMNQRNIDQWKQELGSDH